MYAIPQFFTIHSMAKYQNDINGTHSMEMNKRRSI